MTEGWRYVLTPQARRDMRRLAMPVRRRIFDALDLYVAQCRGDVIKLHGAGDEWRLRVGDYRVRFQLEPRERVMVVVRVLPRDQAYRQ